MNGSPDYQSPPPHNSRGSNAGPKTGSGDKKPYLSVQQLVLISVIAAVFGVVALFNQVLTDLARAVFGLYGSMVFGGLFQTPGIMAYALIRKRGVALITQNLFGLVQVAMGNPAGFIVLWFTFAEAIAQEGVFLLFSPARGADWRLWVLGGIASWLGAQIPNYFFFGFGNMVWWSWLLPIIVIGIPSSVVIPTLLTKSSVSLLPHSLREQLAE